MPSPGSSPAASAPVALGLGGIAAILLISGVQGKSLGDVLKGDFGEHLDPKGPDIGGEGVTFGGKGTEELPENLPRGLVSPFTKKHKVVWGRSDQGVDGQTDPGAPLLAMGSGEVKIAHDPYGFGSDYPVLHIKGDGAFYYGHSVPAVADGTIVKKGQVVAYANTNGQGNAHTPGSFEIGRWPPGSMSAGAALRAWFLALPRVL